MSTETGCDGCIQRHFSHIPNRGISTTIDLIEPIYQTDFSTIMSRADFWATAAMIAAEYGAELAMKARNELYGTSETDSKFKIEDFYFGRVDCKDSPYYADANINNDRGVWIDFPHPEFNRTDSIEFFADKYGFTVRDTVAILGIKYTICFHQSILLNNQTINHGLYHK